MLIIVESENSLSDKLNESKVRNYLRYQAQSSKFLSKDISEIKLDEGNELQCKTYFHTIMDSIIFLRAR